MARKCSVCGKQADTMLYTANSIGNSVLCAQCYPKISSYDPREAFKNVEQVKAKEEKVLKELEENDFPESVKKDYMHFYQEKIGQFNVMDEQLKMITTTPTMEGYKIKEYKGFVSGEVVLGTGFFSSMESSWADMLGQESSAYKDKIDIAQDEALKRTMKEATNKGANAIVGVKMDIESFYADKICILVTGTAVVVEKE